MKVALCAIARLENNYIKEWVEHYKNVGFDKIFLYDNNHDGEEHFEDVIGDYIDEGFVEIIDVRNKVGDVQQPAYNECYHKHSDEFDYMAFFDIDEFLCLNNKFKDIKDFLLNVSKNGFNCVKINWVIYTDNNLITIKDNNYSIKRFDNSKKIKNKQCKSIIKTNLDITINSCHGAHYIAFGRDGETFENNKKNIKCCNVSFNECDNAISLKNCETSNAYLKHYQFKTISEFIYNKSKKGYPTSYIPKGGLSFNFDLFFHYNEKTVEKLKYIENWRNKNLLKLDENDEKKKLMKNDKKKQTHYEKNDVKLKYINKSKNKNLIKTNGSCGKKINSINKVKINISILYENDD